VAAEIIRYALANNFTQIVIGKPSRPRWREVLEGSIANTLMRNAGEISVHMISGTEAAEQKAAPAPAGPVSARFALRPYLLSATYVACAVGLGILLDQILFVQNIALVFLLAILTSAVTTGFWPAVFACILSALAFNFFFLPPVHTLTISDPESVIALGFFLIVGITASNLTARVQRQAEAAQARARTTADLNLFSRKLAGTGTLDDVLWATSFQIASMLKVRVVMLLPDGETLAVKAAYPPDDSLVDADIAAAHWAWEHDRPAGRGADTLPGAKRLYEPIRTGRGVVGVVGMDSDRPGPLLRPDQRRLFEALADQASVAIERIQLVAEADRSKRLEETDRLRSALLSSISHDLKTPLSAVIGAAGTLKDYGAAMTQGDRASLLITVIDESERLNRFIANLLDMTRLGSGALHPNFALEDVSDVVGTALRRAEKVLGGQVVTTDLAADLPMVSIDPVLFEQVLFNLLDNASKYSPPGSTVLIRAWDDKRAVILQVLDSGPGLPEADLERVFDSFYRVQKVDHVRAGTGLGLSICRGFVEAMGGTIAAGNRTDAPGAVLTIRLPIPAQGPRRTPFEMEPAA
jgi:two-component system sensor histidine kinase KdpD